MRSLLRVVRGRRLTNKVTATGEVEQDLRWWTDVLSEPRELSLVTRAVTATITTDASDTGIGYVLEMDNLRTERSLAVEDSCMHINAKELEALLVCLRREGALLEDRKVIWYTDNVTARAAIMRQGTQQINQDTWNITKGILDILEHRNIAIVPKHVPGSLNKLADLLSRSTGEQPAERSWDGALLSIVQKWGPLEQDVFGTTREATVELESLEWAKQRALLKPPTSKIPEVLELLKLVAIKDKPTTPISLWKECAVLVTPLWKKAIWWETLKNLRADWISLGRLEEESLMPWQRRNGHPPAWTASLIRTGHSFGHREPERNIDV